MDPLAQNAIQLGIFDMLHKKLLKALHNDGGECHRWVIVKAGHCRLLR